MQFSFHFSCYTLCSDDKSILYFASLSNDRKQNRFYSSFKWESINYGPLGGFWIFFKLISCAWLCSDAISANWIIIVYSTVFKCCARKKEKWNSRTIGYNWIITAVETYFHNISYHLSYYFDNSFDNISNFPSILSCSFLSLFCFRHSLYESYLVFPWSASCFSYPLWLWLVLLH